MSKFCLVLSVCLLQVSTKRLQHRALEEPLKPFHGATGTLHSALRQLTTFMLASKPTASFNPVTSGVRPLNFGAPSLSAPARPVVMQDSETTAAPEKTTDSETTAAPEKTTKAKNEIDITTLKVGKIVEGKVLAVLDYKAFIDIGLPGGKPAFLFNSDFSDTDDLPDLTKKLAKGKKVRALVKCVDVEKQNVKITCRRNPSTSLEELQVGQLYEGLVVRVKPFGAFIEIGAEVQALLHVSEILQRRVADPEAEIRKVLSEGQLVQGTITSIDPSADSLTVSMKQDDGPVDVDTLMEGQPVQGKVMGITRFGVFLDIGASQQVLLHIKEVLGTSRMVSDPLAKLESIYSIGDTVAGRVIETAGQTGKSAKITCRSSLDDLHVLQEVTGVVNQVTPMGVFVDIGSEVNALMHISDIIEVWTIENRMEVLEQMFQEGDEIQAVIKEISAPRRRIAIKQGWLD